MKPFRDPGVSSAGPDLVSSAADASTDRALLALVDQIGRDLPGANVMLVGIAQPFEERLESELARHGLRLVGLASGAGHARMIAAQIPTNAAIFAATLADGETHHLAAELQRTWGVAGYFIAGVPASG